MDKFTHKMRPPLKKKAKVSVADLMRRGAEKKRPLGANREETHLMGSLGASQLQRIDARIRKTKAKLSDEQLDVVAKARGGHVVLHHRQRGFKPASFHYSKERAPPHALPEIRAMYVAASRGARAREVMTAKTAFVTKQTMKHTGHGQVLRAQGGHPGGEARRPPRLRHGLDGRGRHADRRPNDPRLRGRRPRR